MLHMKKNRKKSTAELITKLINDEMCTGLLSIEKKLKKFIKPLIYFVGALSHG